jgi:hypothetical protein
MSRHGRRRRLASLGGPFLAAAALLLLPAAAGAATTVGSTFDPTGAGFQCGDNVWQLQTTSPSNAYVVPSAGVLTSWSFHAPSSQTPTALKLEVGRTTATPNQFQVVGVSGNQSPADSTTPTYTDISIPVQAGDFLGMHTNGTNRDCGALTAGYTATYLGSTDPSAGQFVTTAFTSGFRLDISASLEADCDGDGLGDETEDADTASCNPPPPSATPAATGPTGKRAAALKKCKKKKSATARKKCKKNANKLPV